MKKQMWVIFLLLAMRAWAAPDMVYHQLPPNCHLVHMGNSWIIQDAKGFFVGYYTPAPPPVTYVPQPRPAPSSQDFAASGGGGYTGSCYSDSYGYGSYARPYMRSGGGWSHDSTPHNSTPAQSGLTQSGWYSFPSVTRSGF